MKLAKLFSRFHHRSFVESPTFKILLGLLVVASLAFVYYIRVAVPNRVAITVGNDIMQATPTNCQKRIRSITLQDQCSEKGFRRVSFRCTGSTTPSRLGRGVENQSCLSTDDLYALANQACGSCYLPPSMNPSLLFAPSEIRTSINKTFSVAVLVDTKGQAAGGVGAQITFDPTVLQGVEITPGSIFPDYPTTTIDNSTGKISISGITSSYDETFTGASTFATISFKLIKSSNSKVNFVYTPGATNESNIAVSTGNGDILSEVHTLSVIAVSQDSL